MRINKHGHLGKIPRSLLILSAYFLNNPDLIYPISFFLFVIKTIK